MFTRQDTKALKGAAVIFMLLHHLAAFPERWPVGFPGFASLLPGFVENGYLSDLAMNGLICVPLFFFLGGYGLYARREAGRFRLGRAIFDLYVRYWKVFILFIPAAFLLFGRGTDVMNPFCVRYVYSSGKLAFTDILANFVGYKANLNGEWWFFGAYICVLPLGCLFCRAIRRHENALGDVFLVFCIDILTQAVFPGLARTSALGLLGTNLYYTRFFTLNKYAPAFFAGIVCAKYDLIGMVKRQLAGPAGRLLALYGAVLVLLCRAWVPTDMANADLLLTPLFAAFLAAALDGAAPVKKALAFLGRHSTNMWLVHSFYCYYFYECTKLVYCTRSVWADLAVLLVLSLGTSLLLEGFYGLMRRLLTGARRAEAPAAD